MTVKPLVDNNHNIWVADTDSYTLDIDVTRDDEGAYSAADKVLVTIKDGSFQKTFVEKLVDIVSNGDVPTAYFHLGVEEAKKIPAGDHTWSYSVLFNAKALPGGGYTADEKVTPFNGWRAYHVEEDPSNARN